jgi:hypothetical protein
MGVDKAGSYKSYIWNFADGFGGNAPNKAIYFGVGGDMDIGLNRPTMEIQDGKIMMGRIVNPDFFFPSTLNIQTDYCNRRSKKWYLRNEAHEHAGVCLFWIGYR